MVGGSPICRNAAEIGAYLGIDKRAIKHFRDNHGLPVWRFEEHGNWKALKPTLDEWLKAMEQRQLKLKY